MAGRVSSGKSSRLSQVDILGQFKRVMQMCTNHIILNSACQDL